jgi:hypothetical protein
MANIVKTNIVVQFGDAAADAGLLLKAEVDSRDDGLNAGNTSFIPGDSVGILLFKDDLITQLTTDVTAGVLAPAGSGTFLVESEQLTFADDEELNQEASFQYPVYSGFTYKWLGKDGGSLQVVNRQKARKPAAGIGIALVSYTTFYTAYRLNSPAILNGETEFSILVLFTGNTA